MVGEKRNSERENTEKNAVRRADPEYRLSTRRRVSCYVSSHGLLAADQQNVKGHGASTLALDTYSVLIIVSGSGHIFSPTRLRCSHPITFDQRSPKHLTIF